MKPPIFHYCCDHGRAALGVSNVVRPGREFFSPAKLATLPEHVQAEVLIVGAVAWFTTTADLDEGSAHLAGLDLRGTITCRRWEHRYRVVGRNPSLIPWLQVRGRWPVDIVERLELHGEDPATWWISTRPVRVELDS